MGAGGGGPHAGVDRAAAGNAALAVLPLRLAGVVGVLASAGVATAATLGFRGVCGASATVGAFPALLCAIGGPAWAAKAWDLSAEDAATGGSDGAVASLASGSAGRGAGEEAGVGCTDSACAAGDIAPLPLCGVRATVPRSALTNVPRKSFEPAVRLAVAGVPPAEDACDDALTAGT
ncbi:MAG: hypothetical protein ACREFP_19985 [Acetobacteraceae bacterium]